MIHVDKGMVKATGEYKVLLQEFMLLVGGMRSAGVKDEDIKEAFKVGFMSEEELENAIKEMQEEVKMKLKTFFDEFFPDGREEP